MKLRSFVCLILAVALGGCNFQSAKFTTKTNYTGTERLKNVYVIVVSDKNTNNCMHYYQTFLVDSLKSYNINADGAFYCCRDKYSDMNAILNSELPQNKDYQNVLTVVITKTVVGAGTTSSRELQLDLLGEHGKEKLWNGKLSISFDWFISDENYRSVARKMLNATLKELKEESIL